MNKLIFLLLTLFVLGAEAQQYAEKQSLPSINLLANPGFENGKSTYSISVSSTVSIVSGSNAIQNAASMSFLATAASQTVNTALYSLPKAVLNNSGSCESQFRYLTNSSVYVHRVMNQSGTIIASSNLTPSSQTATSSLYFACNVSQTTSVKAGIYSSATASGNAIVWDSLHLGSLRVISDDIIAGLGYEPVASVTASGSLSILGTASNPVVYLPLLEARSIPFSNGTTFAENNLNLNWNNDYIRMGIGVSQPTVALQVISSVKDPITELLGGSSAIAKNVSETTIGAMTGGFFGNTNDVNGASIYYNFGQYVENTNNGDDVGYGLNYTAGFINGMIGSATVLGEYGGAYISANAERGYIEDFYGVKIITDHTTPNMVVNNRYQLFLNSPFGVANNDYAIYQSSERLTNYFGGWIGVGTTSATAPLDVHSTTNPIIQANNVGAFSSGSGGGTMQVLASSDTAVTSGSRLGAFQFAGSSDGAGTTNIGSAITAHATEDWSGTALGSNLIFRVTSGGTTTKLDAMKINEKGYVGIGTTNPSSSLHVSGTLKLSVGSPVSGQILTATDSLGNASWINPAGSPITSQGDLIYGAASGVPTRLASGTNGYVLTMSTGLPVWSAVGSGTTLSNSTITSSTIVSSTIYSNYKTISGAGTTFYTAGVSDTYITSLSVGDAYITLPSASGGAMMGREFTIRKNTATFNPVYVRTQFNQPINGVTGVSTTALYLQNETVTVYGAENYYEIRTKYKSSKSTTYTPTFTGFGTPTNVGFSYRRSGSNLLITGYFSCGTTTATEARIAFPSSTMTTLSSAASSTIFVVGNYDLGNTGASAQNVYAEPNSNYITFGVRSAGLGGMTKRNGDSICSSGVAMGVNASVPINGWSDD